MKNTYFLLSLDFKIETLADLKILHREQKKSGLSTPETARNIKNLEAEIRQGSFQVWEAA